MGVFDGQAVSAAITNPAFLDANADDTAFGIIGLANVAPASGATIANTQGLLNHVRVTTGATETTDGTTYSSNTVISNGDDHEVALGLLDERFDGSTGHTHDGTDGNGPIISVVASDPNAIYRDGSQPPTADQPWNNFGITGLGFIAFNNLPVATGGQLRFGFNDGLFWRNFDNSYNNSISGKQSGGWLADAKLTTAPVISAAAFSGALEVSTNSNVTVGQNGIFGVIQRTATGSVTDSAGIYGVGSEVIISLPAINTYANSYVTCFLPLIFNVNSSPITTASYSFVKLQSDTYSVTGRKYGIVLPAAITGGSLGNAIMSDSTTFSGTFGCYLENTNPSFFNGAFRIGTIGGGPNYGGAIEKLSVSSLLTANPASSPSAISVLMANDFASPVTQSMIAVFATTERNSTGGSITDTASHFVVKAQARVDVGAAFTYAFSAGQGFNVFRIEPLANLNACTLSIPVYRGIRFVDDSIVTGGVKTAIRFGTWSAGTVNALICDADPASGNWFIYQNANNYPSQFINSVVVGAAALSTSATDGFLYLPTCAGTPVGTPTARTGTDAVVIDSTNSVPYFYNGGAWLPFGNFNWTLTAGQIPTTVTAAATYNVAASDVLVRVDSTANAITVKLPNPNTRRILVIADVGGNLNTNNLNVQQFAAEKISGTAATLVLSSNYGSWQFWSDGTNWWLA